MSISTVPIVGHPDAMPPGVRTNATNVFQDGASVGAHDSATLVVPATAAGNVGYLIASVESHIQMVVKPQFLGGFVPDQELALINPSTLLRQLDVPVQHFGDGYAVKFLNPEASAGSVFLSVLQVIGPTVDDLILPWLSHSMFVNALAAGDTSPEEVIPQAGVYDRVTVTAVCSDACTITAHWKQVYDTGAGFALADLTEVVGTTMAAGTIDADLPVRTPGLSLDVTNNAAGALTAIVASRTYRLA